MLPPTHTHTHTHTHARRASSGKGPMCECVCMLTGRESEMCSSQTKTLKVVAITTDPFTAPSEKSERENTVFVKEIDILTFPRCPDNYINFTPPSIITHHSCPAYYTHIVHIYRITQSCLYKHKTHTHMSTKGCV